MIFQVKYSENIEFFEAPFRLCTSEWASKHKCTVIVTYSPNRNEPKNYYVAENINDIVKAARNDIIALTLKEEIDEEEVFVLEPAWNLKYFKSSNEEDRRAFVQDKFNIPFEFVNSPEEVEKLIEAGCKLLNDFIESGGV